MDGLLISSSDIAELVDERLPVVSTWRSRFKEGPNAFPEPAGGTPARPLFEFGAVQDWVSRNRPDKDLEAKLLPVRVWSGIRDLTDAGYEQLDLVCWLHSVLFDRKLALSHGRSSVSLDSGALEALAWRSVAEASPEALEALTSQVATASADQLVAVSDFALYRLGAGYGRSGGEIGAVASNVSEILARAALPFIGGLPSEPIIYDGACGIGEALLALEQLVSQRTRPRIIATEINRRVAALAAVRLALHDVVAQIVTADALSTWNFSEIHPDVVMSEPPLATKWVGVWRPDDPRSRFGVPPARSADLAWVVDAAARLHGDARGLVLTTMAALSRTGADERIRASLIRSGALEAIIALPPNLLQYSSVPTALWVLRAPGDDDYNRTVEVVNASEPDLEDATPAKRSDWVRENITEWIIDPISADPVDGVTSAVVHLDELLEAGMDLTPLRWGAHPENSGTRQRLNDLNLLFGYDLEAFRPDPPILDELDSAPHVVTVREMTDSREAKLWNGRGVSGQDASAGTISPNDVRNGVLPPRELLDARGQGFLSEVGDIIFTTMTRVAAVVDTTGGHRLGNGVHALRLETGSRFRPDFVAHCIAARWNERHQKGSTIKHVKPSDLEVPLLPLDQQRQWVHALEYLRTTRAQAQNLVELADDLEVAAQNALRFGSKEEQ